MQSIIIMLPQSNREALFCRKTTPACPGFPSSSAVWYRNMGNSKRTGKPHSPYQS